MPTIYRGTCSNCGHQTRVMTAGYGAVIVDRPVENERHQVVGAVLMSDGDDSMAAAGDQRFVVLRHPLESKILANTGYTWNDLLWQGRYVILKNMICRRCGTVFQHRRLSAPGATGCITGLALGLVAGVAAGIANHNFLAGLAAWYAATYVTELVLQYLAQLYVRRRFSRRAVSLAAERSCPHCHADDATAINGAKEVTCPTCSKKSLTFVVAGIS